MTAPIPIKGGYHQAPELDELIHQDRANASYLPHLLPTPRAPIQTPRMTEAEHSAALHAEQVAYMEARRKRAKEEYEKAKADAEMDLEIQRIAEMDRVEREALEKSEREQEGWRGWYRRVVGPIKEKVKKFFTRRLRPGELGPRDEGWDL